MNRTSRTRAPGRLARIATLGAIALLTGLALPGSAFAGYPPGPFPGPAPGGAFRSIVTSVIVCPEGHVIDATYGHASVSLIIPAGSFAECTQVTVYAADRTVIGPLVPNGYVLDDAFAIGWDTTGAAGPRSEKPLSLIIHDAVLSARAIALDVTTTGVANDDSAVVANGAITFTFDSPTGFAVAMPDVVETPTLPPTSTVEPIAVDDSTNPQVPALLVVMAVIGSLMSLLLRTRSRRIRR